MLLPTVEIRNSVKTIEIACNPVAWNENDRFQVFYDQVDVWNAALPLATIVWEQLPPEGTLSLYRLTATAKDGRVWKIDVGLAAGVEEPVFSFDVASRFEEAEFVPQRVMRDTLIALTREWAVTRVEVVWQ